MGSGGSSPASWRRGASAAAYFVALAGVVFLLLVLLLYCLCYMFNKVKEITKGECSTALQPVNKTPNYPLTKVCVRAVRAYGSMPTSTSVTDTRSDTPSH